MERDADVGMILGAIGLPLDGQRALEVRARAGQVLSAEYAA
jgi:hypothetical protein